MQAGAEKAVALFYCADDISGLHMLPNLDRGSDRHICRSQPRRMLDRHNVVVDNPPRINDSARTGSLNLLVWPGGEIDPAMAGEPVVLKMIELPQDSG